MKKYLVVGLGNPGPEYEHTRHNIGFNVLDALAGASGILFSAERYAHRAQLSLKGRQVVLIKPQTYMNLSGKAVDYWLKQENIPLENLLVITDDLALPFGSIRIKTKGSDGGHNGLKDIQATLNTTTYARFRFGIGSEFAKGRQVDYVLGKWSEEEQKALPERLEMSTKAIQSFVLAGVAITMNQFNGK